MEPFFYARQIQGRMETKGDPHCFLGHTLDDNDGVFAAWDWDGERLAIRNDRYGCYPVYYFRTPQEVGVSTSILRLIALGAPPDLDYEALSVYLRIGFMLAEDTPFTSVRALPPGARMHWSKDGFSLDGALWIPRRQDISRSAALDGYRTLFQNAIRKRRPMQENFCVALTGGRDSRHIVLELREQGFKPKQCVTMEPYPPRSNEDLKVAAEVTKALGLDHVILRQPDGRFRTELKKNLITSFCTDEHQWSLAMADYFRGRFDCLYDGIGGDVLTQSWLQKPEYLSLYEAGEIEKLAWKLLPARGPLPRLLPSEAYKEMNHARALERLSRELRRHASAPNPIGSFYFWNRTRREISLVPFCILSQIGTVHTPFLDRELFDFLSSLPGSLVVGSDFHTEVIRQSYPAYANIRFEDKDAPLRPNFGFFRRWAWETLEFVLRNRSGLVRKRHVVPRLVRCLLDPYYSSSIGWIAPLTIYLLQIERFVGEASDATRLPVNREANAAA